MKRLLGAALTFALLRFRKHQGPRQETGDGEPAPDEDRSVRRQALLIVLVLLAGAGLLGLVVLLGGLVPIKASAGHWAITEWVLQLAKRRSVSTHSFALAPPAGWDRPANVLKGAGHFELGCAPCHGSPLQPHPRVARAMLPAPPDLSERAPTWDPDELFYIVKHGIKFTGMPAWPAPERDDEVWSMVAFLTELPRLAPDDYSRLVFGAATDAGAAAPLEALQPPQRPAPVHETCNRCHGSDGTGRGTGVFPRLAGQQSAYLLAALEAYARDERKSGVMQPIAAGLSPQQMRALAAHYADLPGDTPPAGARDDAAVARGQKIANEGVLSQRVPACGDCHGPGPQARRGHYPLLAGQYADYLALQLRLLKRDQRGGSSYAAIMRMIADRLTEDQIADVAAYFASLPAAAAAPAARP